MKESEKERKDKRQRERKKKERKKDFLCKGLTFNTDKERTLL